MGRFDNVHGDEDEIDQDRREQQQRYDDEHADDWKYGDDSSDTV